MENSSNKHPSVDTLLAVMSEQMKTLLKSVESIEKKLEAKVDLTAFNKLEQSFEEHKKDVTSTVNSHAVKMGIGAGLLTGISWIINFLK